MKSDINELKLISLFYNYFKSSFKYRLVATHTHKTLPPLNINLLTDPIQNILPTETKSFFIPHSFLL